MEVAALYVREDTIYRALGCDVWDEARDATGYAGPYPVICHPPCGRWADYWRKTGASFPGDGAPQFMHALACVRRWGGCIEHPWRSRAWGAYGLRVPTGYGYCVPAGRGLYAVRLRQAGYGHPADKDTVIVLSTCVITYARPYVVAPRGAPVERLSRKDREATPLALAQALYEAVTIGRLAVPERGTS